jgi:plasmid maintenance system antidote protein VapI
MSQSDFAQRIGASYPRLDELTHGKGGVTPDPALRRAQVLQEAGGLLAGVWPISA